MIYHSSKRSITFTIVAFLLTAAFLILHFLPQNRRRSLLHKYTSGHGSLAGSLPDPSSDYGKSEPDYGLDAERCQSSFGELFYDINRAVAYRKSIGNVTRDDVNIEWHGEGAVRALVRNKKIFIIETTHLNGAYGRPRALALLLAMNRAISSSQEHIPDVEFAFSVSDRADPDQTNHTIWALSRRPWEEEKWLMSDFGYWSWPLDLVGAYEQIREQIRLTEPSWEHKQRKAFWRGAASTNSQREALLRETRGKDWADVEEVHWKDSQTLTDKSNQMSASMADHCRYQYLIQTEGRSYSGRGKYLLNCESVFMTHKMDWIEPHTHLMIDHGRNQNIVQIERDFPDLDAAMRDLLEKPEKARAIARKSAALFRDRYLTPAAQACYWRHLFRAWSTVSFVPDVWEEVDGRRKLRGVPLETFVLS